MPLEPSVARLRQEGRMVRALRWQRLLTSVHTQLWCVGMPAVNLTAEDVLALEHVPAEQEATKMELWGIDGRIGSRESLLKLRTADE